MNQLPRTIKGVCCICRSNDGWTSQHYDTHTSSWIDDSLCACSICREVLHPPMFIFSLKSEVLDEYDDFLSDIEDSGFRYGSYFISTNYRGEHSQDDIFAGLHILYNMVVRYLNRKNLLDEFYVNRIWYPDTNSYGYVNKLLEYIEVVRKEKEISNGD